MKLNLPDVTNVNSVSVINSNFAAIEQELQDKVLYRDNPDGEPNTLETPLDANGQDIYNVSTMRTTDLYIDGERVVPVGVVVVEGDTDISGLLVKTANLSDVQSAATSRINLGLGNVSNTSDANKPLSTAAVSALTTKQNTLVSGTNIKTINGNTVLGSGDLVLTGVGETNTTSNLGTGEGLAATKVGVNLPFKSIKAGTNVTLSSTSTELTVNATVDTSSLLVKASNLSDVQSAATSRVNLGLGNVDNTTDLNKPISTATSSALAGKQATLVSASNIKTINGATVLGSGDLIVTGTGGNFLQAGTGAVTLTMQNKVRESVSVKDFGATGDGVTDDTNACQLALNSVASAGGAVYFPSGAYKITSSLMIPQNQITIYGDGTCTRLFSSGTIFTYPTGVYVGGYVAIQNIHDMLIEQTADGTSIVMTQTWDALGKPGPTISNVLFYNSSLTTTSAIAIRMQGVWSAAVDSCWFIGRGVGGGPTTGVGGYGIRMVPGIGTTTSIMNVIISNSTFITVAFPIYMDMRNPTTGGVIEGIKITGNNMAAGYQGITTSWSLATSITGNQVSDYQTCIKSTSDFDMSITGNSELHGTLSGINLTSGAVGYGVTERITITGNNVGGQGSFSGGSGVRLSNTSGNDMLRNIVITGNSFRGNPGSSATGYGISLEGSNTINGCSFTGNSFAYLLSGFFFSGVGHSANAMGLNTFKNCGSEFTNFSSSGAYGNPLIAATAAKTMIQAGTDTSGTAPTITFPVAFKSGTQPAVFFTVIGTANTTMEQPAISNLSNTGVEIQKKQFSAGSIVLTNYTVAWTAIGEAA